MEKLKKLNKWMGFLIGFLATLVYAMTMEATVSLWDCGEFIASSQKLQVVHPPGGPLFLMIGRMFTLPAELLNKPEWVAYSINFMSALSSGLAMMFLFWITTHISQKLVLKDQNSISQNNILLIIGAGIIAALTGTFLDTVWFSAVEGEVYSMSLLFTSVVFWLTCVWERKADEPFADRWLVLIAFIMGCSIFVHWLNMLSIPAIALIYYFKRYTPPSFKGIIATLITSVLILLFLMEFVITGIVGTMAKVEVFLVNSFGLPFNSGLYLSLIIFLSTLTACLYFAKKTHRPILFNSLMAFSFILIGFSTITTVPIRSNAEINIDMNGPGDLVTLASYLNREQYGQRPLATGYYYSDKLTGYEKTGFRYKKNEKKGNYEVIGNTYDPKYKNAKKKLFPRIHSDDHSRLYESWLGLKKGEKPSGLDNIKFFFIYQLNHMYIRYFMWNFVGRQSDEQGTVNALNGNWISGVSFLENPRAPEQINLPEKDKNHPYRNTFYYLPLLLGLVGMVFHFKENKQNFLAVLMLFLMTGVALTIYGNSPPIEPRERDYIFAASFWTFSIWIGIGMIALYKFISKTLSNKAGLGFAFMLSMIIPVLMGVTGWDEHDRSERYFARDLAANYLNSCAPNAILFTQGDNDTYPLWYAQQVENIRPDVQVVNLSLLQADWYINQKRNKVLEADPVPMSLSREAINGSNRDMVLYYENKKIAPENKFINLQSMMKFIGDDKNRLSYNNGSEKLSFIPTKKVSLPVDKAKVLENDTVAPEDAPLIVDKIEWELPKDKLVKDELMILDIIATNNWERPIYFAVSVSDDAYMGLQDYFQIEGLTYRLVPIKSKKKNRFSPYDGRTNTNIMYANLMNKFKFGNMRKEGLYLSNDVKRMANNLRSSYMHLADSLIEEGKPTKAIAVIDKCIEEMPDHNNPYNAFSFRLPLVYYQSKANEKGNEIAEVIINRLLDEIDYYENVQSAAFKRKYLQSREHNKQIVKAIIDTARRAGETEFATTMMQKATSSNIIL